MFTGRVELRDRRSVVGRDEGTQELSGLAHAIEWLVTEYLEEGQRAAARAVEGAYERARKEGATGARFAVRGSVSSNRIDETSPNAGRPGGAHGAAV